MITFHINFVLNYVEALPGGVPCRPSLVSVFINACHLLSALLSLLQFGRGRLSLVAISFYALSLLFGPCRLSEFTLAGPLCCLKFADLLIKITCILFCSFLM